MEENNLIHTIWAFDSYDLSIWFIWFARNLIFLQFLYFWNFSTDWWNENFRTSSNHVDYFQHQVLWLRKHEKPTIVKIKCLDWRSIKKPHKGWTLWLLPVWLQVFKNQVLLLKKHEKTHTGDEPFGCYQCDFEISKSSALIEETWKKTLGMNPLSD